MRVTQCVLIGVGGGGSILLEPLARLLAHHPSSKGATLTLIDGDTFDDGNAARQMGCQPGSRKVDVACSRVKQVIHTTAMFAFVKGDDIVDLIPRVDAFRAETDNTHAWVSPIVILAVDNHATRKSVLEALRTVQTDALLVLSPGNSDVVSGQVKAWSRLGWKDLTPYPLSVDGDGVGLEPEILNPTDEIPTGADCITEAASTPKGSQLIVANMLCAALTLALVHRWLEQSAVPYETGFKATDAGFKVYSQ